MSHPHPSPLPSRERGIDGRVCRDRSLDLSVVNKAEDKPSGLSLRLCCIILARWLE